MKVENTKIPSSKGDVSASIHRPQNGGEKLAVLCPGFLDSKDYNHLVRLAQSLCERGYTVVRFNPTGTWDSDGDNSDYKNTQYLDDVKSIIDHMLGEGNYKEILVGGHSRGGQISVLYSARDERVSTVVGIMPSSNRTMVGKRREDWQKAGFSISYREIPNENGKIKFKLPFSHVEDRDKYDIFEEVKKVKSKLILLAGEKDDLVLPEDVKKIYENANEPKRFVNIPNIGHDYRHNESEISLVNKIILEQLDSF